MRKIDYNPGESREEENGRGVRKILTILLCNQLALRFYDPITGSVTLDGVPISDLNVNSFVSSSSLPLSFSVLELTSFFPVASDPSQREQVSLVSQEPTLYSGTVRFNILLGAVIPPEQVTQSELEEACRSANILEFIQSLPVSLSSFLRVSQLLSLTFRLVFSQDGFETQVGGKGTMLSGGQKQVSRRVSLFLFLFSLLLSLSH